MPRYEYRPLTPSPEAEKNFLNWIAELDRQFQNPDPVHRSDVVRDTLHEIYLGTAGEPANTSNSLAAQALVYSFDPRNITLEPDYYGDVDAVKYAER